MSNPCEIYSDKMIDEEIHGDMTPSNSAGGKRYSKKVTPAEGAISWDTVADAGEVDHDDEEDTPNQGVANKNVSFYQI